MQQSRQQELERHAEAYGVDEFLCVTITYDFEARLRSYALLAEEFLDIFDGFSIGSNDLTQLTLGVDRDSGLLTGFDERHPAVLKLMEMAIRTARKMGKYAGICGQAPSDYPEITAWLVRQGIASISLNPDSVIPMTRIVLEAERNLK